MDTQLCNGFQTDYMFYLSRKFDNCDEKNKPKQIQTSVNWERVQYSIALYNVFMLSSLANQKGDILLSIL